MRIGCDLRPFLRRETGVGLYFKNLLFHLAKIDAENEYLLFSSSWKERFDRTKIPPFRHLIFRDVRIPVKVLNTLWNRLGRPTLDTFFGGRLDLTHSATPLVLPTRGKTIVTIHDLFFMDFPGRAEGEAGTDFVRRTRRSLENADGILTFSRYTKGEIVRRFGVDERKVRVVYHGLDHRHLEDVPPEILEEARRRLALPSTFLLFVGRLEPRKNIPKLIEALKIIRERCDKISLVLAGPEGRDSQNIRNAAIAASVEPWVHYTGYLTQDDLRCLYRQASALVFPSLCEGFGFPVIEAMAAGLPVAVSRNSAFPETAGDAALYFEPENPESITAAVVEILNNGVLRDDLRAKGTKQALSFSWDRAAAETLDFYRQVASRGAA